MQKLKKMTRAYFTFSKKERNVALYLSACILIIIFLPSFQKRFFIKSQNLNYDSLQTLLVSIPMETKDSSSKTYKNYPYSKEYQNEKYPVNKYSSSSQFEQQHDRELFPFDPNLISLEEWQQLGVHLFLAQRIINYRNKGGKFKTKEDLLKTYGFSQELYDQLQDYIVIDTLAFPKKEYLSQKSELSENASAININMADKQQLISLGFSADNALRIINFRESVGGIYSAEQLYSVYGLDMEMLEQFKPFLIIDGKEISKLNLNNVTFEQLANHAYISDELAKSIIDYRTTTGKFYTLTELMKVKGMYPTLFDKLKPYFVL